MGEGSRRWKNEIPVEVGLVITFERGQMAREDGKSRVGNGSFV